MNKIQGLILATALAASQASAAVPNFCGDLKNHFGPLDFRDPKEADSIQLVVGTHYTEEVEQGLRGHTGPIGADLDYTLRAIPNHPRALATLAAVARASKVMIVPGTRYPVECYFERALRFQPNDGAVHGAYGNFLYANGRFGPALQEFQQAVTLSPDDAAINYNLGLAYLKTQDYANATRYAKKAYALGFPLPGLKNMLVAAGKWTEDPPQ